MRFSQRNGITPLPEALKPEAMPDALRNSLWNAFDHWRKRVGNSQSLLQPLWRDFWKLPLDAMPVRHLGSGTHRRTEYDRVWSYVRERYFSSQWFEVYDFLDFYARTAEKRDSLISEVNQVLVNELAAYRVVGQQIVPVTEPIEIAAIETALADKGKFAGASVHLATALAHLSDRANPDYRNSIKESISAVESVAKIISGEAKAELGTALNVIEKNGKLHGALKNAYKALYGYTSDADGIRHALMEDQHLNANDAKFFLLVCVSFVNYLKTME
ncbi:AbiJ-NTD4 domain-containing protein [Burkholderia multivorans]|uniref:AbiJ-NTD4 domain-containing protein n=1 Tax=Burkholderia multivorans TaxID=87883 RepID=UPI001C2130A1|nr:hypothetical protein [Burkholderia multivorans]MBU9224072.1 hypothetical protein [Burkholderia multivorans]MBU9419877.1 hypothetical protein [Burkholderia multivorans]MBU9479717.1 hypothetical protein [Burkholderia multivorans]